jgi:single-stranded-DNA-specific exonuclease
LILQAQQFASEIEAYNSERKDLDKLIKEALQQIEQNNEKERFTRRFQEDWQGVIGMLLRLIETYYRPTLVLPKRR